ncbi:MAG: putative cation efflux rotein [Firmicutes bacterium]|nr:putative cation efflux rotein [Bacillota bacterium]
MSQGSTTQVKKVLWIILFANLIVAVTKIIIGSIIQSSSMTADGFHSLTDGVSNIIGLIGIGLASKPVDKNHPYGHKKYEFLTSLFIGGMLLVIVAKIVLEAIERIVDPIIPQFGAETIAALIATLVVNFVVCVYENRQGKRLNSFILISDSLHTKSDIYVSLGVLLTLIGIKLGAPPIIDPIMSIIVGGFIIRAAVDIIKSTSEVLVDKASVDLASIQAVAKSFAQVADVHEIRSRGSDTDVYVDMHIIIDPTMNIEEAHGLVHEIEEKLKSEINPHIQVMVHTEPLGKQSE